MAHAYHFGTMRGALMTNTKTTILAAARNRIAIAGVRGLRVNDVAAEAGVSPGLLYYHFTDRAGLMAATLEFIDAGARAHGTNNGAPDALHVLLGEIEDNTEVRKNSVAWNELRSVAVFEKDLAGSLAETTHRWNRHTADALAADAHGGGVSVGGVSVGGVPVGGVPVGGDVVSADLAAAAEILTSLVEGLSGRWLSGSISTERARELMRVAHNALTG